MRRLDRYELDSKLSLDYIQQNFNKTNELSSQMLDALCSGVGEFYVLLPEGVNLNRIHELDQGYITSCINKEICRYVIGVIEYKECSCIFDDVNAVFSGEFKDDFTSKYSLFYEDEVYYSIKRSMLSEDAFFQCMKASDGIWHSLCVVTDINLDEVIGKGVDQDMIREICANAQLAMISAYDGEGYIFWEKR